MNTNFNRIATTLVAVSAGCFLLAAPASTAQKELDSVKLKAKPDGIPAKIAAVSKGRRVFITLSVKKKGSYEEVARDTATGVAPDEGPFSIEATQAGGSFEKNGGEGLFSANGAGFAEYFNWNAKRGKISFYDSGETD